MKTDEGVLRELKQPQRTYLLCYVAKRYRLGNDLLVRKVTGRRGRAKSRVSDVITIKLGLSIKQANQAAQHRTRLERMVRLATAARADQT